MAVTSGTITSVDTKLPNNLQTPLQAALVLFTISGTYAQANGSQLLAVDAAIQNSRRNGKTVNLVQGMFYQAAFDAGSTTQGLLLCIGAVTVSGSNLTFHLYESATPATIDVTDEFADATPLPALGSPLGILVTFYES